MGYNMHQTESDFSIAHKHKQKALKAVKQLPEKNAAYGSRYASVEESFRSARTLEEALDAWRWRATTDEDGHIIDLHFEGEKAGEDEVLFNAIAPYVKEGSYLQMAGEDGAVWRWSFDGKSCHKQRAKLIFDND